MTTVAWTLEDAVALCKLIEDLAPAYGCHVALTGGVLYKEGPRKDLDILLYRIRQAAEIDQEGLFVALSAHGFVIVRGRLWCFKALYQGKPVDVFFPEEDKGNASPSQSEIAASAMPEIV